MNRFFIERGRLNQEDLTADINVQPKSLKKHRTVYIFHVLRFNKSFFLNVEVSIRVNCIISASADDVRQGPSHLNSRY